jgi:hypothetical protein
MLLLMIVPCYTYITPDVGVRAKMSLLELLKNSWNTVREYAFGAAKKEIVVLNFSRTVMGLVVSMWTLFAAGLAAAIYSAVVAFRYFADGCRESRSRILYVTLTANRALLCAYFALTLPIFVFPTVLKYMYRGMLNYYVELTASPFDMLFVALLLYAAVVAVIIVSRRRECELGMDVYAKREHSDDSNEESIDGEYTRQNGKDVLSEQESRAQAERIMRLLGKQDTQQTDGEDNR